MLLETTVRGLPLKQRLAFVMRKIHDIDYEAIGRSLDCSAESARAHVFQALRKIRLSLNGHELPPTGGVDRGAPPAGPTERRGAGAPPSESPLSRERPRSSANRNNARTANPTPAPRRRATPKPERHVAST